LEKLYLGESRLKESMHAYLHRLRALTQANRYDLVWMEKELLPFLPAVAERWLNAIGVPFLVDYDDAMFHRYDLHRFWPVRFLLGQKIDAVMKNATAVVAGNDYLAKRAENAGAKCIHIVPTVVDLNRYPDVHKKEDDHSRNPLVVGWIGTPKTSRYLKPLRKTFEFIQSKYNVRFVAVGASKNSLADLPLEVWPWTERTEAESIRNFDIGIMPLDDSPWERGKCGYKLIQYMACSLPVIASPVGINVDIVSDSRSGLLASTPAEWECALSELLKNAKLRRQMGSFGRQEVERTYNLAVQGPILKRIFKESII
jgi:glycosyltransferase involved in cell wall biosynthesis